MLWKCNKNDLKTGLNACIRKMLCLCVDIFFLSKKPIQISMDKNDTESEIDGPSSKNEHVEN